MANDSWATPKAIYKALDQPAIETKPDNFEYAA